VSNFVCTAWLVDDTAAREFAVELYSRLLGMKKEKGIYVTRTPEPMHSAMRGARLAVAEKSYGVQTWGAYQHYGNPRLRFFDKATLEQSPAAEKASAVNARSKGQPNKSVSKKRKGNARAKVSAKGTGKRAARRAASTK
jgi:hypothetical protein